MCCSYTSKNTTADPSLEKSTEIISEDLGSDLAILKYYD